MRAFTFAALAAAALLAGCNSRPAATVNSANMSAENMTMNAPMNDQSAMESATNAGMTAPPPPAMSNATNSSGDDVLGATKGGDTGGNTVQSNVSGM